MTIWPAFDKLVHGFDGNFNRHKFQLPNMLVVIYIFMTIFKFEASTEE